MRRLLLTLLLFAAVLVLPIQADFVQCVANVACAGGDNADVMNGSSGPDQINSSLGNDLIIGGDGRDNPVDAGEGNDVIFGGLSSDRANGEAGNDTIVPGPDDAGDFQQSTGGVGNDTFVVLVSETINCQTIDGNDGLDVLHLIGFGPYVAELPYGATSPIADGSAVVIQDPIAGGYIIVFITDQGPNNLERINGLSSANPVVLAPAELDIFTDQNCAELI